MIPKRFYVNEIFRLRDTSSGDLDDDISRSKFLSIS